MPGVPDEALPEAEVVFHTGGTGGELPERALPLVRALLSRAAPPCFISFLNLERLFWNQIFTCGRERGEQGVQRHPPIYFADPSAALVSPT